MLLFLLSFSPSLTNDASLFNPHSWTPSPFNTTKTLFCMHCVFIRNVLQTYNIPSASPSLQISTSSIKMDNMPVNHKKIRKKTSKKAVRLTRSFRRPRQVLTMLTDQLENNHNIEINIGRVHQMMITTQFTYYVYKQWTHDDKRRQLCVRFKNSRI